MIPSESAIAWCVVSFLGSIVVMAVIVAAAWANSWPSDPDPELDRLLRSENVLKDQISEFRGEYLRCPYGCESKIYACVNEMYDQLLEVRREIVRHKMAGGTEGNVGKPVAADGEL